MNKRKILLAAGCTVLVLFAFISCKTAPKPEAEAPEADVQATVVQDQELKEIGAVLKALVDRTESLRASCEQYRVGSYYPDDWTAAETLRNNGQAAVSRVVETSDDGASFITADDYDVATVAYTEAASLYEKILSEGLDRLALDLGAELARERESAIAAGARSYFPEQFNQAELAENAARASFEADDIKASYDSAQLALLRYKTLQRGMEALALKKVIDDNGFVPYAPDAYEQAGVKYNEAANAYGTADAAALEAADQSVMLYGTVKNAGYQALSSDMKTKAEQVREMCDSIKASRSMAAAYADANGSYTRGDAFGKADDWESAYNAYADSAVLFTDVFQQASLKKNAADAAMEAARNRQEYSSELARKADEIVPLPEDAEGFSDEPEETVLSGDTPPETDAADDSDVSGEEE